MQILKLKNEYKEVSLDCLVIDNWFYFVNVEKVSSNLKCVSYDLINNILRITFKSNESCFYCYFNVDKETFVNLLYSESLGKYFIKNIKNKYQFQKIEK